MIGVNGDLMLWKHFGVGGEVNFEPGKKDYVSVQQQDVTPANPAFTEKLQSRLTLYDFNGIFQPLKSKRAAVKISKAESAARISNSTRAASSTCAIVGHARTSVSISAVRITFRCTAAAASRSIPASIGSSGRRLIVHYVHNLTQFGRDSVISYTVWLGYTFGQ